MSQTLEQFQAYQTRLEQYDQAIALLYWDLQTAAPKDSIEAKLSAVGYFSTESFRRSTADEDVYKRQPPTSPYRTELLFSQQAAVPFPMQDAPDGWHFSQLHSTALLTPHR